MRFYDEVTIHVQSGKGGDGIVTGRREKGIPFGGPSGGNGGAGGSVILRASKDENTLLSYRYKSIFKPKPGEPGRSKDQYGSNAENMLLTIPVGTLIRDKLTGKLLHAFTQDGEERTAVEGGEGGVGNMHFKDAVNQYPNFCLLGEPGHKKDIILELQLLADVALIGSPSVGKSSIINSISNTKAKVADYPFTTLAPNLGSVLYENQHFNVIDIPGLIKGAAEGKGLGNAFLRHILKSRIFCIVVDIARYDTGITEATDILEEIWEYIQKKFDPSLVGEISIDIKGDGSMMTLYAYHEGRILLEKRVLFLVNKYDLVNDEDILKEYLTQLKDQIILFLKKKKARLPSDKENVGGQVGKTITKKLLDENLFVISAATHYGINDRLKRVVTLLRNTKPEEVYHLENIPVEDQEEEKIAMITEVTDQEKKILLDEGYIDEGSYEHAKVREVRNAEICKLVRQMWRGNQEAENFFWKTMDQKGFLLTFDLAGIHKGDILKIVSYYAGKEDRYIVY